MKKCLITVTSFILLLAVCISTATALTPKLTPSKSYSDGVYYSNLKNVTLTGNARTDFVNIVKSQLGYHEGYSSSDLSGNSSGGSNYTEYGRWIGSQGIAWCASFVSWCAAQAGIPSSVIPKTCNANYNDFSSLKIYKSSAYTPKAGDIVLIGSNNSSSVNHVGVVTGVDGSNIYTAEGNCSDKVKQGTYSRSTLKWGGNMKILYFAVPDFESLSSEPEKNTSTPVDTKVPSADSDNTANTPTVDTPQESDDAVSATSSLFTQLFTLASNSAKLLVQMIVEFFNGFFK